MLLISEDHIVSLYLSHTTKHCFLPSLSNLLRFKQINSASRFGLKIIILSSIIHYVWEVIIHVGMKCRCMMLKKDMDQNRRRA